MCRSVYLLNGVSLVWGGISSCQCLASGRWDDFLQASCFSTYRYLDWDSTVSLSRYCSMGWFLIVVSLGAIGINLLACRAATKWDNRGLCLAPEPWDDSSTLSRSGSLGVSAFLSHSSSMGCIKRLVSLHSAGMISVLCLAPCTWDGYRALSRSVYVRLLVWIVALCGSGMNHFSRLASGV